MKKNLIIGRCGNKSLHLNWLNGCLPNFDLVVTFYGDVIPDNWAHVDHYYRIEMIKGSKWKGLYTYLKSNDEWRNYERIFLPDDDLLFDSYKANKFFDIVEKLNCDICQPSLDRNSFYSHAITINHPSFNYRVTNFVELMAPCFSVRMLEKTLEMFNETESGWGMDHYWWNLARSNNFNLPIIVDDIEITHTRPVGSANHGTVAGSASPIEDLNFFKNKYKFKPEAFINLAAKMKGSDEILSIFDGSKSLMNAIVHDALKIADQLDKKKLSGYLVDQIQANTLLNINSEK